MIKIRILSPGKIKEPWLHEALQEYIKRLTPYARFDLIFTKNEQALEILLHENKKMILLDPEGMALDSQAFSEYFFKAVEMGGTEVSFAIGGPDGFSKETKQNHSLISLSKMTFTHQIARLILVEQIYRAFEIRQGSHYHR